MTRMTGGHALLGALEAHGVDTIFALPGVQLDHLFTALYDERHAIRVVHTRHEQAAAYMAFGFALSTGRAGTFAVVPGPGLLNAGAALATAYACCSPVLALTGQIPSHAIGRGYGLLHELPDQLGLMRGLTKWSARMDHPAQAPDLVREAFRQLQTGPVRPVGLEMPMDMLALESEVRLTAPLEAHAVVPPDLTRIEEAADVLAGAQKPCIVCGGGVQDAAPELLHVAELLQAPVVAHRMGRGAVSDEHYLSQSLTAGYRMWPEIDVVLAVGTRFQHQGLIWGLDDALKVVRIDADPTQMHRMGKPAVGVVADAASALGALGALLESRCAGRASRVEELRRVKHETAAYLRERLGPQAAYIDALRDALPREGIVVDEQTQVGYVARTMFPVYRPRTYLSSGYQGTLGAGFPTALGAKVGNPDTPVLSINGDGGFMFNVQELATAVKHGIGLVSVVFNDNAFGNVKRMQQDLYGGRVIASDLANPDFPRLAESFGVSARRASTPDELRSALESAFADDAPALIEVPVERMPDPWGVSQPMKPCRGMPSGT